MKKSDVLWLMKKHKNQTLNIIEDIITNNIFISPMKYSATRDKIELFYESTSLFISIEIEIPEDESKLMDFYLELPEITQERCKQLLKIIPNREY